MNLEEIRTIAILLYISPALIVFSLLMLLFGWIRDKFGPDYSRRNGVGRVLAFSAGMLGAVWCLRYAVGYFAIITGAEWQTLTKAEEVFNSAIHALQTLSMDEEYTEYIQRGKQMLTYLLGDGHWSADAYGIYAAVLNFISPVVGGAVIFEILASVFPRVRMLLLYLVFWREKCFFSELNPDSLAMAESLRRHYPKTLKKPRPVLIFTDTYVDDEKEKDYELLLSAKQLGAICVRDDLLHVTKNILGKRSYYLMDRQEMSNLQTLQAFAENARPEHLRRASIFLFVRSDLYVRVERQVQQKLKAKIRKRKLWREKDEATVIPVQSYRNLVHNLLSDVPLYEPLVHKKNARELNITILGNGIIGTEAFLSVYWMGQMMTSADGNTMEPVKLRVDVVSKDEEKDFWSKIEYINPEIKKTKETNHKILADGLGGFTPPYITVEYHKADVKSGGFLDLGASENSFLKKTDYFIVALGNDEDNITVAERLRLSIGKAHLERIGENSDLPIDRTVITYAVFDPALCRALNEKRFFDDCVKGKPDIFMHAFGSREQVFSCENVWMSQSVVRANEIGAAYIKIQLGDTFLEDNKIRAGNEDKNYTHWANIARALHIKYKVFSLGMIGDSLFKDTEESELVDDVEVDYGACFQEHQNKVQDACMQYQRIAITADKERLSKDDQALHDQVEKKRHLLAWLEHRRWCAFTRTMGYRHTSALKQNLTRFGKHKNMPMKLHPCLVEAKLPVLTGEGRKEYILATFEKYKYLMKETILQYDDKDCDCLDQLSCQRFAKEWEVVKALREKEEKRQDELKKKKEQTAKKWTFPWKKEKAPEEKEYDDPKLSDFKEYDYYYHDFGDYCVLAEATRDLRLPEWFARLLCVTRLWKGAIRYKEMKTWFIPQEIVENWMGCFIGPADEKAEAWLKGLKLEKLIHKRLRDSYAPRILLFVFSLKTKWEKRKGEKTEAKQPQQSEQPEQSEEQESETHV